MSMMNDFMNDFKFLLRGGWRGTGGEILENLQNFFSLRWGKIDHIYILAFFCFVAFLLACAAAVVFVGREILRMTDMVDVSGDSNRKTETLKCKHWCKNIWKHKNKKDCAGCRWSNLGCEDYYPGWVQKQTYKWKNGDTKKCILAACDANQTRAGDGVTCECPQDKPQLDDDGKTCITPPQTTPQTETEKKNSPVKGGPKDGKGAGRGSNSQGPSLYDQASDSMSRLFSGRPSGESAASSNQGSGKGSGKGAA